MNISYSFTAPESLLIVAITALILLLAVCLVMFIDIWRKMRNMRRQKKTWDEYNKSIQRKEDVERKARHRL
ncbi:hypothetical protein F8E82_08775 [Salmonella enterica]|nr:hypothetical protein [Salmonella enterica]ECT0949600.1 hypothetical protein [Salmonella enterica subsp. enterica serovar Saintpaul]ECX2360960.1 hypothetical protein [Salmonella enterica subsp. enterica serovar Newport]ECX6928846.1 hypothetical protein [Salmonella enterica subsp. enterica serovar Montevideo]EAT6044546.1 hypothetical protein [Salmonella enterica]